MRYLLALLLLFAGPSPAAAIELATSESDDLRIGPEVEYVSAGPSINDQQTHYRVILLSSPKGRVVVQKIVLDGARGQIKWSRLVGTDQSVAINPKEFGATFSWHSPTSFSFESGKKKFIIKDISRSKPELIAR